MPGVQFSLQLAQYESFRKHVNPAAVQQPLAEQSLPVATQAGGGVGAGAGVGAGVGQGAELLRVSTLQDHGVWYSGASPGSIPGVQRSRHPAYQGFLA